MNIPLISVIIPARREAKTIKAVVQEAKRISSHLEVIVVCNGADSLTVNRARRAGAQVIEYPHPLGHDVGRAVGANHAKGEILLFIDADFVVPARVLRQYCHEVWKGSDVVLNAYSGLRTGRTIHPTSQAKRLLNFCLGRPDLNGASMTTVPHALSRRAAEVMNQDLMIPPKALATALLNQLKVKCIHAFNVSRKNRKRTWMLRHEVERLILGDHAEALALLLETDSKRARFTDFMRKRELIHDRSSCKRIEGVIFEAAHRPKVSVIICAYNEQDTIGHLLAEVKKLLPYEIIVVENGSTDRTLALCQEHEVTCITLPTFVGHDVGRAIGAREARGDILIFLDADIILSSEQIKPFIIACNGHRDLVLNDINPYYHSSKMIDYVSMAKFFLNQLLDLAHLQYSSLTAVPHAIKKSVLQHIGYEQLAVPPKAYALAALKGFRIDHISGVNVIRYNKKRAYNHKKRNVLQEMIVGDHLEAVDAIQQEVGLRGYLYDTLRERDIPVSAKSALTV
jgi:glycosyltransferase involved in cell wall biosynthesis